MSFFKKLFWKRTISETGALHIQNQEAILSTPESRFSALSSDERLGVIMSLGDTGQSKYFDLMKFSIQSDPDLDVRFAALKRIHLFKDHPDLIPFLKVLHSTEEQRSLEPYLSMALCRVGIISEEELQSRINSTT